MSEKMKKLKEHDLVELKRDLSPELRVGAIGTIVHVYNKNGKAFEVEFEVKGKPFVYTLIPEEIKRAKGKA